MKRTCPICQQIYSVYPSELARGRRLTCSIDCRSIARKQSTEQKNPSCPHCGHTHTHGGGKGRFVCQGCGREFYSDRPPKVKTKPKTNAERQEAYRKRKTKKNT